MPPKENSAGIQDTGRWEGEETGPATAGVASRPPGTVQKGTSESPGWFVSLLTFNSEQTSAILQQSRSACSISRHLLLLSILWQWHHPSSSVPHGISVLMLPFPLPNCSSFLLLSILSSSPEKGTRMGRTSSNCISVRTNKRGSQLSKTISTLSISGTPKILHYIQNILCIIFN